jgi:hypothetical protein
MLRLQRGRRVCLGTLVLLIAVPLPERWATQTEVELQPLKGSDRFMRNRRMKKWIVLVLLGLQSGAVLAEGNCPPGFYPIGGQGVQGCAPIPQSGAGSQQTAPAAPVPTGEWETRWGAIAEDSGSMSTGVSTSRKSKEEAVSAAVGQCTKMGGKSCKLRIAYFNQCVAIADPKMDSAIKRSVGRSSANSAATEKIAKQDALKRCSEFEGGQSCDIVYSACSLSEFRPYR